MTIPKDIFLDRVEELADETHDDILKSARELLKSGAVDLGEYEDNYILPKLFMTAYALRMEELWSPPRGRLLDRYKNQIETMKVIL